MRFRHVLIALVAAFIGLAVSAEGAWAKKVQVIINKVTQKMTVMVDGDIEYVWPISSGAPGYETPSGTWKPFRMEAEHFSKEWDDAPMPHSIFFTARGHAVHGSYHIKSLGRRASHGCVRLHPDNAAKLFSLVGSAGMSNTTVVVKGGFFDFGPSERKKTTPWFTSSKDGKSKARRSFASINSDIEKTTVKKPVAKKKPKKVAEKCTVKDGKKVCKKPLKVLSSTEG